MNLKDSWLDGEMVMLNEEGEQPGLVYAGRVGTGFNQATLKQLHQRMS